VPEIKIVQTKRVKETGGCRFSRTRHFRLNAPKRSSLVRNFFSVFHELEAKPVHVPRAHHRGPLHQGRRAIADDGHRRAKEAQRDLPLEERVVR